MRGCHYGCCLTARCHIAKMINVALLLSPSLGLTLPEYGSSAHKRFLMKDLFLNICIVQKSCHLIILLRKKIYNGKLKRHIVFASSTLWIIRTPIV